MKNKPSATRRNTQKSDIAVRMGQRRKLRFELLEDRRVFSVDVAPLLDINAIVRSSNPTDLVEMGGFVYFTATTDEHGAELWKSDGTAAGTVLVKDIRSGSSGSSPISLVNVNGTLFFRATDGPNGQELWKSDGTDAGTVMVKDIWTGGNSFPQYLTNVNGTLYFRANDGVNGQELWKSDGTASGTVMVKDIRTGGGSSPLRLTNVNGTLFFSASDGTSGVELWKSDGTASGTVRVKDIVSGANSSDPVQLTNVNGVLYFGATDSVNGLELWKSDGTDAGTTLVKDINPGVNGSRLSNSISAGSALFFTAFTPSNGYQLWKSDGTSSGTTIVKSIVPNGGSGIGQLTNVNGTVFFEARDFVNGYELWKSDGTAAGTVLVKDISPGTFSSGSRSLTNVNGTLYFRAKTEATGYELWKSDGTASGTVMVKDIRAGVDSSVPLSITNVNGNVFFRANDGLTGYELWRSDGTSAGTVLVKDITPKGFSSDPRYLTEANGQLFFSAENGVSGTELWKSNGTSAGTTLVKDINSGSGHSTPSYLTRVGGTVFFRAFTSTSGGELWKSDGTEDGTVLVKDIVDGNNSSYPFQLTDVNGTLFFVASTGETGQELWKSDGTVAGTVMVKDINPGINPSGIFGLSNINGVLFFRATDGFNGYELWKSDGTESGTVLVADINTGVGNSFPNLFTSYNGLVYFSAGNNLQGRELWKSDGTAAGTVLVKDLRSGTIGSQPSNLAVANNKLFFTADNGNSGYELWQSDGTAAGTVIVKDLNADFGGSSPSIIVSAGGTLFFAANTSELGFELWKTDGTSAGTSLVKDIRTGTDWSNPNILTAVGGTLYFQADDGINGAELWKSDGTSVGTVMVSNISKDDLSSLPEMLTAIGTKLFFRATTDTYGTEIYVVEEAPSVPTSILLSTNVIAENSPSGTIVGLFSTIGSQVSNTTFEIVGDTASIPFVIVGNVLSTSIVLDYEARSFYSFQVRATSGGVSITRDISIFVGAVNEFDPLLTSPLLYSVPENTTAVVNLAATDQDLPIASFAYSVVGGADAARFVIVGNRLSFASVPDFEAPVDANGDNQYIVHVAVSDGGRSRTNSLTITVTNSNEAPTSLALSNLTFAESMPAGSVIGTLSANDADGPNPIGFSFFSSSPNDNADFQIVGNQLVSRRDFDYETLADRELLLRIVARDGFSATSSPAVFNLNVTDAAERPIAFEQSLATTRNNLGISITLAGSGGPSLAYSISGQPTNGILTGIAPNLVYVPNNNFVGTDEFFFTVTNGSLVSFQARVEIVVVGVKPTIQFSSTVGSDSEGIGTVNIGITLSVPSDVGIWIPVGIDTVNSTATLGTDFSPIAASVYVAPGQTSTTLAFSLNDDNSDEPDEVAVVRIGSSPEFTIGTNVAHSLTILDNDLPPTLSLWRTSLVHPESNLTTGTSLLLSAPLPNAVTIAVSVTPIVGSASVGTDYEPIPTTVTIPAGATSVFVPITLKQDTAPEATEAIVLVFDGSSSFWPAGITQAQRTFTLTITDDDQRVVNVQSSVSVGEAQGNVLIKATLSPAPTEITRVPFVRSGNALFTGSTPDYLIPAPDEFVFGVGQTEATITATIIDDSIVESTPEFFTLRMQAGSGYVLGTRTQTSVGITDNDKAVLSFTVAETSRWEGDPAFNITATLDRPVPTALVVPIVLSLGSGTGYAHFADYSFQFNSFEFAANQVTSSRSFFVANDTLKELTEVLTIAFGDSAFNSNSLISRGTIASTRVSIQDNDPVVSVALSNAKVSEGSSATFTFSIDAATNVPTVVPFKLSGTSVAGTHHNAPTVTSVTIPVGQTSAQLAISTRDNSQDTATDPTLTVSIGSVSNASVSTNFGSATATITDNDVAVVDFPSGDKAILDLSEARVRVGPNSSIRLNRAQRIKIEMSKVSDKYVDVTLSFSGKATRDKDYKINGLTNGKLRIPAGKTSESFELEILHDTAVEGNETLFITIDSVSAPATLPKGTKPARQFGIIDDDKAAVTAPAPPPKSSGVTQTVNLQPSPPGTLALDLNPSTTKLAALNSSTSGVAFNQSLLDISLSPGSLAIFTGNQGPIEGATAYFDSNFNLILDDGEVSSATAIDGSFALELDPYDVNANGLLEITEGRFVLFGGVDLASGQTWKTPLTAPVGLFNITPISTLVESLIRTQSLSLSDAISRATSALDIPNYNLLDSNSIYEVLERDGRSAKAYNAHTQLYSTVISIAQLMAGKSGRSLDALGLAVFDQIAQLINSPNARLDLTQSDVIEGIVRSTAASEVISGLDDAMIASAAGVIVGGTSRLAAISLTENTTGQQYLLSINKAKTILQGSLPEALFELGSGTKSISQVEADFTGVALDSKIAAVNATVTVPPAIGIDSLGMVEGNAGQTFLRFSVAVVGEHAYPISTNYFTVDGTAIEGSDYTSTSGALTWAAGDNNTKYIDVPILGDSAFEADEYFKVLLGNSSGLVVRVDEGTGFILNDEATAISTSVDSPTNAVRYNMSADFATVLENGVQKLTGEFANSLSTTIAGQNLISDQLTLDFTANTFRADTITFQGGTGAGIADAFTAVAGLFETINYSVLGVDNAALVFSPASSGLQTKVNLAGIEMSSLLVAETNKIVFHVPGNVTSLIVEDADSSQTGRLRIRSGSNAFAPIEFTNPGTLEIRKANSATVVTVGALDPNFSSANIVQTSVIQLTNVVTILDEGTRTVRVKVADVSIDPNEMGPHSLTLAGAHRTYFELDGSTLYLKANSILNFELLSALIVDVVLNDPTLSNPLAGRTSTTLAVGNLIEFTAPVQIGDGTVQRSVVNKLVVPFDQAIAFDPGAFQVFQRSFSPNTGFVLVPVTTNVTLTSTSSGMNATLTFSGSLTRAGTNGLVDGDYQLHIDGDRIRIANTTKNFDADNDGIAGGLFELGNAETDRFFALLGDANGNGQVDAQDLLGAKLALRKTVGQTGYNIAYDVNGNGSVDAQDIRDIQLNLRKRRSYYSPGT